MIPNLDVGDSLDEAWFDYVAKLGRGCRLTVGSAAIAAATSTTVPYTTEGHDDDGFHSTSVNTSRITIPTGFDGRYLVGHSTVFTSFGTGTRQARIIKNGSSGTLYADTEVPGGDGTAQPRASGSEPINLVAGDYLEHLVYQNSGGAMNIAGVFWIAKIA